MRAARDLCNFAVRTASWPQSGGGLQVAPRRVVCVLRVHRSADCGAVVFQKYGTFVKVISLHDVGWIFSQLCPRNTTQLYIAPNSLSSKLQPEKDYSVNLKVTQVDLWGDLKQKC